MMVVLLLLLLLLLRQLLVLVLVLVMLLPLLLLLLRAGVASRNAFDCRMTLHCQLASIPGVFCETMRALATVAALSTRIPHCTSALNVVIWVAGTTKVVSPVGPARDEAALRHLPTLLPGFRETSKILVVAQAGSGISVEIRTPLLRQREILRWSRALTSLPGSPPPGGKACDR